MYVTIYTFSAGLSSTYVFFCTQFCDGDRHCPFTSVLQCRLWFDKSYPEKTCSNDEVIKHKVIPLTLVILLILNNVPKIREK